MAPLTGEGARGLADDVATFRGLVVTTDTIACSVHFLPDDPLDTVAQKVVRVNVSDLVAKGAAPVAMTLASSWHADATQADHADFARGLGQDLGAFSIALLGGDTTRLPEGAGPVFTVTMIGVPLSERIPSRGAAEPGDVLLVSGTIGDGFLGLQSRLGRWKAGQYARSVEQAYRVPDPPAASAEPIARYAKASLDVSDGLLADAGHMAASSSAAITIDAAAIPLSEAGQAWCAEGGSLADLCTGGDDYQALVAVSPDDVTAFLEETSAAGSTFTPIGSVSGGGSKVRLVGPGAKDITPKRTGYQHW